MLAPLLCLLAGLTVAPHQVQPQEMGSPLVDRRVFAMGTELHIKVWAATRESALGASEACVRQVAAAEERLSCWSNDSEVSRLNAAPVGQAVALTPALRRDLERAAYWQAETRNAFSPTLGALIEAWGLRGDGRLPSPDEIDRARQACAPEAFPFVPAGTATRHHEQAALETGGFGKGAALDEAIAAMLEAGASHAILDFGGQVALAGTFPSEAPVTIEIAHPRQRDRPVLQLRVTAGSLATSGNGERGLQVEGQRIGHLLDPRTGRPARDFGSVTVWTREALDADCLSTALFVLGPQAALDFAREHDGVEVAVLELVADGLRARVSPGWKGLVHCVDEGTALEGNATPSGSTSPPANNRNQPEA